LDGRGRLGGDSWRYAFGVSAAELELARIGRASLSDKRLEIARAILHRARAVLPREDRQAYFGAKAEFTARFWLN